MPPMGIVGTKITSCTGCVLYLPQSLPLRLCYNQPIYELCFMNHVFAAFQNGWSALHWAADRGNREIVEILVDSGIDPLLEAPVSINIFKLQSLEV